MGRNKYKKRQKYDQKEKTGELTIINYENLTVDQIVDSWLQILREGKPLFLIVEEIKFAMAYIKLRYRLNELELNKTPELHVYIEPPYREIIQTYGL